MFVFAYGATAYLFSLVAFLYTIGFVENSFVSRTIDGTGDVSGDARDVLRNILLLGLFAAQHSLMARPAFKQVWRQYLPESVERSTYTLVSSLLLMLVFLRWTPLPFVVWNAGINPLGFALDMLSYAGWALVVVGTFQFDHLEFLGLRQVLCHLRNEELPLPKFDVPHLYRWVRHPIHAGLLLAFWATPRMTLGHLMFAGLVTAYVLYAVRLEERDLASEHREYRAYQARVPMLFPNRRPLRLAQRQPGQAPPARRSRAS